jgi:nickel/cobalt transporter (NicO) family protein
MRRSARALALSAIALFVLPAIALAHPLGNFTINHYAGVRIEPDRVLLDVVIDQAEIPAFQARQALDTNEDGEVSDAELEAGRVSSCTTLAGDLDLAVGGDPMQLTPTAAGLELRPGVGGLSTLRQVCGFEAPLAASVTSGTQVEFRDTSFAGRIGWREIVVEGSGVAVSPVEGELRAESASNRLLAYPADLLDDALADERVVVSVAPGGPELPLPGIPDATPIEAVSDVSEPTAPVAAAAVPGGVAGEIPALFQTTDLTPFVVLLSLATAAVLGAAHALTPGHGKTLMAAYLVGTRGTTIHAFGLGLSVSVSHTIGILALAALVIGAQGVLSPDLVIRAAPVIAALGITVIGGWMLVAELRRRRVRATPDLHDGHHDHDVHDDHQEHSHGGVRHSHAPVNGATITWRSLFVLGLAGGIIPSTSALLILLGAIASGRAAFGIVLVLAFGLGMAIVMTGIGLLVVGARSRLDGLRTGSSLAAVRAWLPLGAACLVLALGVYLTFQAVAPPPTL